MEKIINHQGDHQWVPEGPPWLGPKGEKFWNIKLWIAQNASQTVYHTNEKYSFKPIIFSRTFPGLKSIPELSRTTGQPALFWPLSWPSSDSCFDPPLTLFWPWFDPLLTLFWPCSDYVLNLFLQLSWPCLTLFWPYYFDPFLTLMQFHIGVRTGSK